MADAVPSVLAAAPGPLPTVRTGIEQGRALARERFRTRLLAGEKIGDCACHDEETATATRPPDGEPRERVAGVRFRDSGRTYYFQLGASPVEVGDWVVVETNRGREAGRVVIAPHQVRLNQLQGDLKPILRRLGDEDVRRMEELKREAAAAVRTFGARIRARGLGLKPISAEYSFDGSSLVLNYSTPDRERAPDHTALRDLSAEMARTFGCRVELRSVGPRDEARLLGGLGRCGRTLCCSSWLPVYPEISMNMAKTQELPLNPTKVSGVCGRLLCCLSYENEQYKQVKAIMPRLGQTIETPAGSGVVQAMQLIKELVTVRLVADNSEHVFRNTDLGLGTKDLAVDPAARAEDNGNGRGGEPLEPAPTDGERREHTSDPEPEAAMASPGRRRRRRRGRRGGNGDAPSALPDTLQR